MNDEGYKAFALWSEGRRDGRGDGNPFHLMAERQTLMAKARGAVTRPGPRRFSRSVFWQHLLPPAQFFGPHNKWAVLHGTARCVMGIQADFGLGDSKKPPPAQSQLHCE